MACRAPRHWPNVKAPSSVARSTPPCGDTPVIRAEQSQAGNSSRSISGAKNDRPRAKAAMRGPSRHTTSRLTAGACGRAAIARARSADDQTFGAIGDIRQRQIGLRGRSSSAGL